MLLIKREFPEYLDCSDTLIAPLRRGEFRQHVEPSANVPTMHTRMGLDPRVGASADNEVAQALKLHPGLIRFERTAQGVGPMAL